MYLFLQQSEIDAILSGQLTQEEEDDVLIELDKLLEKEIDVPQLPNVPKEVPFKEKTKHKLKKDDRITLETS